MTIPATTWFDFSVGDQTVHECVTASGEQESQTPTGDSGDESDESDLAEETAHQLLLQILRPSPQVDLTRTAGTRQDHQENHQISGVPAQGSVSGQTLSAT